jgi:adenylyltransferase/sulfurtransferase
VLGVLPGIIGSLQAAEAIKIVTDIGEPLVGRLLLFDALSMTFRTITLRRDPECPTCGLAAKPELIDYDRICAAESPGGDEIREMSPRELAVILERGDSNIDLVDVREPYEWNIGRIQGARLVPLGRVQDELKTFGADRETVLYCKSGVRSLDAARQLARAGICNVANLSGGILRWREEVDPTLPAY